MSDRLPEETEYRDDGCRVHPSCLSCPLPSCIYEERAGLRDGKLTRRRASLRARDMEVVRLVAAGWTTKDVGDTFGLSRRQVFRILAAEKLSVVLDEDGAIWTLSSSSASSPTSGLPRTA
jgi:DNA-binding CsgD family transcriptional regulator